MAEPGRSLSPVLVSSTQPNSPPIRVTITKPNDGQSTALQGATSAFAAQPRRSTPAAGVKPETTGRSNNRDGARKAAILAGGANNAHPDIEENLIAGGVKGKIKQFSSPKASSATSQASLASTNPQRVAALLAVDRSASRTAVQLKPKHAGNAIKQKVQGFGRGNSNYDSVPTTRPVEDISTASSIYGGSNRSNENSISTQNTQQVRTSRDAQLGHNESANPRGSRSHINPQNNPDRKPIFPPRDSPPSAKSLGDVQPQIIPIRGTCANTRTGAVNPKQRLLPMQGSQSNLQERSMGAPSSRDALEDARVASSVASSRAPSPAKASQLPPPPPPPQHRRTRSRSLLLRPPGPKSGNSRTPGPTKSLRQTMRVESKSDNEGEKKRTRRSQARMIRPHPHKHNEGGRKRWRDTITERERRRYEGVWAANKGLLLDPQMHSIVVNVIVRDIWSRSRLAPSLLGRIWDLVSHDTQVMELSREEFVVGMWLVDQSLLGRKLPWKVSDSIWESVRQRSLASTAST